MTARTVGLLLIIETLRCLKLLNFATTSEKEVCSLCLGVQMRLATPVTASPLPVQSTLSRQDSCQALSSSHPARPEGILHEQSTLIRFDDLHWL